MESGNADADDGFVELTVRGEWLGEADMHKFNLRELLDEFVLEQVAQDIAKPTPEKGFFQRFGFGQAGALSSALLAKFRHVPSRTA